MGIDDDRLRTTQALDVVVGADLENLVPADRERLRELGRAARVPPPVGDDEIAGPAVVALRADDQPGDERACDDQDNDVRREAGRHAALHSRRAPARSGGAAARPGNLTTRIAPGGASDAW